MIFENQLLCSLKLEYTRVIEKQKSVKQSNHPFNSPASKWFLYFSLLFQEQKDMSALVTSASFSFFLAMSPRYHNKL